MSRAVKKGAVALRIIGGIVAYGGLAAFLSLVAVQLYRWLRAGEWTHIGISDGLAALIGWFGVRETDAGRLAELARWLDAPTDWLGWHRVLDALPASLLLFALSVVGNWAFIYAGDRLDETDETDEMRERP